MPKGIKGFQKGHKSFVSRETYVAMGKKSLGHKRTLGMKFNISDVTRNVLKLSGERVGKTNVGRCPWNKGTKGVMKAWNKGIHKRFSDSLNDWRAKGGVPWNKGLLCSEERKRQMSKTAILNPNRKYKNTSIELLVEGELKRKNIEYQKQVPICKVAIVDFYLPQHNTVIECDGDYWHNRPESIKRDEEKNKILTSNGYNVLRFWEFEIKRSVQDCLSTI